MHFETERCAKYRVGTAPEEQIKTRAASLEIGRQRPEFEECWMLKKQNEYETGCQ